MNIFSKATLPKPPKTADSVRAAYLYAAILAIFALGQLFTFNEFLALFTGFGVIGGDNVARLMGGIIVICEVFALPFLLGMRLNKFFRTTSMVMGWIVAAGWLKIAIWLNIFQSSSTNIGFLGTKVPLIPGWWAVSFVLALCILAAWASWGLWPGKRK